MRKRPGKLFIWSKYASKYYLQLTKKDMFKSLTKPYLRQLPFKARKFSRVSEILHNFFKILFFIIATFDIFKSFNVLQV